MSVISFNPYDSNDWESYLQSEPEVDFSQLNNEVPPVANQDNVESPSSDESDVEIPIQQDVHEPDIIFTDLANVRELLASRTGYTGGQLGTHLKQFEGLLIMPLHSTSVLRIPNGKHVGNPPVIVFLPSRSPSSYPNFPNFLEAVQFLYHPPQNEAQ